MKLRVFTIIVYRKVFDNTLLKYSNGLNENPKNYYVCSNIF